MKAKIFRNRPTLPSSVIRFWAGGSQPRLLMNQSQLVLEGVEAAE
jgi:hypothetical protein